VSHPEPPIWTYQTVECAAHPHAVVQHENASRLSTTTVRARGVLRVTRASVRDAATRCIGAVSRGRTGISVVDRIERRHDALERGWLEQVLVEATRFETFILFVVAADSDESQLLRSELIPQPTA